MAYVTFAADEHIQIREKVGATVLNFLMVLPYTVSIPYFVTLKQIYQPTLIDRAMPPIT